MAPVVVELAGEDSQYSVDAITPVAWISRADGGTRGGVNLPSFASLSHAGLS